MTTANRDKARLDDKSFTCEVLYDIWERRVSVGSRGDHDGMICCSQQVHASELRA
jgi:hypothetical protein